MARSAYRIRSGILLVLAFIVALPFAHSAERTGELRVSDLLVEPQFSFSENKQGGFSPGNSYLGVEWRRDRLLSAHLKVGSLSLLGTPARYGSGPAAGSFGAVEAYAQADSDYGRLRMGLVPIPFGLEGGDSESRLRFPRGLLFRNRMANLRDYGLSYRIAHEGFFSDWAVHNGESGPDLDTEAWFTARWGWQGGQFFRIGFSGMAGRTTWRATNPLGTSTLSGTGLINLNETARIRIANFFVDWEISRWTFEYEATAGDTRQDTGDTKLRHSRLDIAFDSASWLTFLARGEIFDPRSDQVADQTIEASVGIALRSQYENSVLYVLGTKSMQEDVKPDSHRFLVLWRVRPEVWTFRSAL